MSEEFDNIQEGEDLDEQIRPMEAMPTPEEAAEVYDMTAKARKDALLKAEQVLLKAHKGAKIDRKDICTAIRGLLVSVTLLDQLVAGLIKELIVSIQATTGNQLSIMAETSKIRAIVLALEEKGVVTQDELQRIHQAKVMPEIMAQLQKRGDKVQTVEVPPEPTPGT